MDIFLFILFGILGGVLGGMGMGGGTLLIPLLTIFLSVEQKTAQGINLIAFLPMAIIALIIHFKNKMVSTKEILWIIIPGVIASVSFSFLASSLDNKVLGFLFGIFLILIAVYEAVELAFDIKAEVKNKSKKVKKNKKID
ncbi:MAG: sulfite exporter TauE/SafE family protein [Firmicutes bacterium]|nr:sulfite exporter TauE/SafE family protein [Bacillota bacterium]